MNKTIKILLGSYMLLLFSCSYEGSQLHDTLPKIKIEEAFSQKNYIKLSEFTQGDIEYIRLETREGSLIGTRPRFYADNMHILALTYNQMLLFDRRTGKFIREDYRSRTSPGPGNHGPLPSCNLSAG